MSASDAAPLPRLGEVFFDVRGDSRSMRLSWYADTGVAVFSIWQGGRCTGTFRLPIDDLPRMVGVLQRGPQPRRSRSGGGHSDWAAGPPDSADQQDFPTGTCWQAEEPGYQPEPAGRRPLAGVDSAESGRDRGHGRELDYRPAQGEGPGYGEGAGRERGQREGRHGYEPEYGEPRPYREASDYGELREYGQPRDYSEPRDDGQDRDRGAADPPEPAGPYRDDREYGQERFVPPYVRSASDSYLTDNSSTGSGDRGNPPGPAYPADRLGGPSSAGPYPEASWTPESYFDGRDNRLSGDQPAPQRHSPGRHGGKH